MSEQKKNGKEWLIRLLVGITSACLATGAYALTTHNQVIEHEIRICVLEKTINDQNKKLDILQNSIEEVKLDVKTILRNR